MMRWASAIVLAVLAAGAVAQDATAGRNPLLDRVQDVLDGVDGYVPAPSETAGKPPLALDVDQCVSLALEQNAQVLIAIEEVTARRAQNRQAKSALRPQLKSQLLLSYQEGGGKPLISEEDLEKLRQELSTAGLVSPDTFDLLLGDGGGTIDLVPEKENMLFQVSLEQVVYAGGQLRAAIRASEHLARSEEWKRVAVLDALEYEVRQAFYDCLLAQALVYVAEDSIVAFQRHTEDANRMLDVGLVSQFVVLRAETELSAREGDLESAKSAVQIAELNLRRLLVLPQDQPLDLEGELAWRPVEESVDALAARARKTRAELRALDDATEAAAQNVRGRWGQYLPTAGATVQWQDSSGTSSVMPDGWTFSLGAEWEIYAGGRRKQEVIEAKAQLRSLEHQRADVTRLVELDVRQAYIRVQEAIAKIRKEKSTVALGREGLRLAELRFQEGVGIQAETLDAELAFSQARTAAAQALRNYAVALAALDKALGQSLVRNGESS